MTTLASNVRSVLLSASEVCSQKLRRDSVLFNQDQDSAGLFLIEEGLVKLTRTSHDGNKLIVWVAGPHQLIGDECLAGASRQYAMESKCLTEVIGHHIPQSHLKRVLADPEQFSSLLHYVTRRTHELLQKLEMQALRDVEHRVLHGLASLAALVRPNSDGTSYSIPMTQADLACFVGATRETTSTTLGALKERGLVTLSRRLVTTVHPDELIKAANDRLVRTESAKSAHR